MISRSMGFIAAPSVIAGPDPAIHLRKKTLSRRRWTRGSSPIGANLRRIISLSVVIVRACGRSSKHGTSHLARLYPQSAVQGLLGAPLKAGHDDGEICGEAYVSAYGRCPRISLRSCGLQALARARFQDYVLVSFTSGPSMDKSLAAPNPRPAAAPPRSTARRENFRPRPAAVDLNAPPDGDVAVEREHRRGRDAQSNGSGRYEPLARIAFDDGWQSFEELPPFKTTVTIDTTRRIITRNDSPDISFDRCST